MGALQRRTWAQPGHLVVGLALVAWIVVQVGFLGWPPHWLQVLCFAYGWVIVVLAAPLLRHPAAETPPGRRARRGERLPGP